MSRLEEAVNDADLILECVVEDLEIKKDLLESKTIHLPHHSTNEPPRGKTNYVVSEQVRHKPACTSTEKS